MVENDGSASDGDRWQTPTTMAAKNVDYQRQKTGKDMTILSGQAKQWPTPDTARRGTESPDKLEARRKKVGAGCSNLLTVAEYWPTPRASERMQTNSQDEGVALSMKVSKWPTPDTGHERSNRSVSPNASERPNLALMTSKWPTPAARDHKGANSEDHLEVGTGRLHLDQLPNFVTHLFYSPPDPAMLDGGKSSATIPTSRLRLNPMFGSWLMGWPSTWVIAEPHASSAWATELFRFRLQRQLLSFFGEPEV